MMTFHISTCVGVNLFVLIGFIRVKLSYNLHNVSVRKIRIQQQADDLQTEFMSL